MRSLLLILIIPLDYIGKNCLETPVLITYFRYVLIKYAQNFKRIKFSNSD